MCEFLLVDGGGYIILFFKCNISIYYFIYLYIIIIIIIIIDVITSRFVAGVHIQVRTFLNRTTVLLSTPLSLAGLWLYTPAPIVLYMCVWFAHHTPDWELRVWFVSCSCCSLRSIIANYLCHLLPLCSPSETLEQHRCKELEYFQIKFQWIKVKVKVIKILSES